MPLRNTISSRLHFGAVVGTVHSPGSLKAAQALGLGSVDFLELRVDAFAGEDSALRRLRKAAPSLPAPLIVTVRDPREGGANKLPASRREALVREFLEFATLVDVELRSVARWAGLLGEIKAAKAGLILSHHDFRTTPPLEALRERATAAHEAGATVFKIATVAKTPRALSALLQLVAERPAGKGSGAMRLAVMGMGPFGKISRLVLGGSGSVLNYGYLDKPQVPGQWPATLLKERLRELR